MPTPSFLKYFLILFSRIPQLPVFFSLDFWLLHCSHCFLCQFMKQQRFSGFFLSSATFSHWIFHLFQSLHCHRYESQIKVPTWKCGSDYPTFHSSIECSQQLKLYMYQNSQSCTSICSDQSTDIDIMLNSFFSFTLHIKNCQNTLILTLKHEPPFHLSILKDALLVQETSLSSHGFHSILLLKEIHASNIISQNYTTIPANAKWKYHLVTFVSEPP